MTNLGKLKCELQNSRINKWIFSFSEEERVEKGVTYQDLNNFPEKQNYEKIKAISFLVFDDELELVKKLPNYLTKLPNLKNVSLPIDWLNQLDIPDKIVALTLTNSLHLEDQHRWNKTLDFLRYLSIPELIKPFEFSFSNVPNLEWINLDMKSEKKESKIIELSEMKKLKHVSVSQAKNFDVFSPFFEKDIISFELFSCKGKKFPIQKIKNLTKLKYLRINNISVEFDCSWLLELPVIEELDIINVNNLSNVEALLEVGNLKNISICNCNKPIKNKMLFEQGGFDLLDIDYS